MIEQIVDYWNERLKPLQLYQFRESVNFSNFLSGLSGLSDEYESAAFEVLLDTWLDSAEGAQLDQIAEIVGVIGGRAGRDDGSFRSIIKAQIRVNASFGQPEVIISTILDIFGASRVEYTPIYPAKVRIWQDGSAGLTIGFDAILDNGDLIELDGGDTLLFQQPDPAAQNILKSILPAGVGLYIADDLILDDGAFLELDDGGHLIVI